MRQFDTQNESQDLDEISIQLKTHMRERERMRELFVHMKLNFCQSWRGNQVCEMSPC